MEHGALLLSVSMVIPYWDANDWKTHGCSIHSVIEISVVDLRFSFSISSISTFILYTNTYKIFLFLITLLLS